MKQKVVQNIFKAHLCLTWIMFNNELGRTCNQAHSLQMDWVEATEKDVVCFFFQHTAGFHFALGYKMDIFFLQICIVQNKARVPWMNPVISLMLTICIIASERGRGSRSQAKKPGTQWDLSGLYWCCKGGYNTCVPGPLCTGYSVVQHEWPVTWICYKLNANDIFYNIKNPFQKLKLDSVPGYKKIAGNTRKTKEIHCGRSRWSRWGIGRENSETMLRI